MGIELLEALRKAIEPGQAVGYVDLLERLKAQGYDTAGIGVDLARLQFRSLPHEWRGSEFVTYRVPVFDQGAWTDGELRIVRAEDEAGRFAVQEPREGTS